MIKVFNSAYNMEDNVRHIALEDVTIITQGICQWTKRPYIFFEHKDYPLGPLRADFYNNEWKCDLD